jgi:hypothetical protein
MQQWRYYYHGLNVQSVLPLPELSAFEKKSVCDPDVSISLGGAAIEFVADGGIEGEYRYLYQRSWLVYSSRRPSYCRSSAESCQYAAGSGFPPGFGLGALLYQRKMVLIHASAVQVNGAAVVFCGQRGEGKSTLAALLDAQGHSLVSDDLCCLKLSGGETPMVYPSVPRMRLWSDAIRELGWETSGAEPDHIRAGKFQYLRTKAVAVNPLPIREIYLLGWGRLASSGSRALSLCGDLLAPRDGVATYWLRSVTRLNICNGVPIFFGLFR